MTRPHRINALLITGLLSLSVAPRPARAADTVRLKDGTEVSAIVLRKDGDSVLLQIARDRVDSINGEPLPEAVAEGSAAPDFVAVDVNGATHALSDPSAKVTLLKFWASWCPYCRADINTVKDLYSRYHDKGLRVLAISVDQDADKLRVFLQKEPLPYPVILTAGDGVSPQQAALSERYETHGIPSYFIIAKGKIAKTIAGSVSAGKQDLETPLKELLAAAQ